MPASARTYSELFLLSVLLTGTGAAFAEDKEDTWGLCPTDSVFNQNITLPTFNNDRQIDISAVSIRNDKSGLSHFSGNVLLEKNQFRLTTDALTFDKQSGQLTIPGSLHIETENMVFDSGSGEMNRDNDSGIFHSTSFRVLKSHLRGEAPFITQPSANFTTLKQASFTSCEPGDNGWSLSASKFELDQEDRSGSARNVVLRVRDIPLFYLPYISFPLGEERRSGVLAPSLSLSDGTNGNEFSLPYYWNIAPNQDATITPNFIENRGLQLQNNYRYLNHSGKGELDLEFLQDDRIYNDDRYLTRWTNKSTFKSGFGFNTDISATSDSSYMTDFGNNLELTSLSHLEQRADLLYNSGNWNWRLREQRYQTIDDSIAIVNRPYRRTPQLTLNGKRELVSDGLEFKLDAEWVNFEHESDLKNVGQRLDLHPMLSWPVERAAWFFKPSVSYRATAYDIVDSLDQPLDVEQRELPIYQIDTGLFLERKYSDTVTQTLEPRLYYLNIPAVDQSTIPLFDTSEPDFSFSQLFRYNRFNGGDRVGDANQLTTALTTRFIDDTNGNEYLSASIGQIHYFADREVSLNETAGDTQTGKGSDIAAELLLRDSNWSYKLTLLQNIESNEIDKGNFLYRYKSDKRHIFNIGYRYRRDAVTEADNIDQTDLSFKWPVSRNWSLLGRWNYSLKEKADIENIFGFEYDSCCLAFRVIGRGYQTTDASNNDVFDRSILFTLVLKGIGSTGKANSELERAILGFQPEE